MASFTSVNLSSLQANSRTGPNAIFATITVVISPVTELFAGSLALTGVDAAKFGISTNPVGNISNLFVVPGQLPVGQYHIGIIATQAGLTNSPFTQSFVIQSIDPTLHQNLPPIPFPRIDAPFVNEQNQVIEPWVRFLTNVWSQTNGSGFVLNSNSPVPAAPASGQVVFYVDPADGGTKLIFPTGKVVVLGVP